MKTWTKIKIQFLFKWHVNAPQRADSRYKPKLVAKRYFTDTIWELTFCPRSNSHLGFYETSLYWCEFKIVFCECQCVHQTEQDQKGQQLRRTSGQIAHKVSFIPSQGRVVFSHLSSLHLTADRHFVLNHHYTRKITHLSSDLNGRLFRLSLPFYLKDQRQYFHAWKYITLKLKHLPATVGSNCRTGTIEE